MLDLGLCRCGLLDAVLLHPDWLHSISYKSNTAAAVTASELLGWKMKAAGNLSARCVLFLAVRI
jgi:hypothetical protein